MTQPHRVAIARSDDDDDDDNDDSGEDARVERLESQSERLTEQLDRTGPPCPHCGGALAADAASKQYRLCPHCRLEVLWHEGEPFANQSGIDASIEAARRRQEARESQKREAQARARAKLAAADAEHLAARDEFESTLADLGVGGSPPRCRIHTTLGILVAEIRVTWSLEWAIWIAAGIKHNVWIEAPITRITPNHDWETGFSEGV